MNPATMTTTVDKSGARVREMFGQIAGRYDFMNHLLSGGVDHYWRWAVVKTVPPVNAAPILDVCTGTGDLAFSYWKAGKRRCPVIGTDFTFQMLTLANQKRDKQLVKQVDKQLNKQLGTRETAAGISFFEADTQQLPFPDNQFQIVSVGFGLRNVSDTRTGLKEMLRVCQPGGKVVVLEFSQPTNPLFSRVYRFYFRHILPRIGQLFARNGQSAYHYLPASVSEFPCGQELANIMQECGMTEVKFRPLTVGIATLYYGTKH